jgi:hypothetical protein
MEKRKSSIGINKREEEGRNEKQAMALLIDPEIFPVINYRCTTARDIIINH